MIRLRSIRGLVEERLEDRSTARAAPLRVKLHGGRAAAGDGGGERGPVELRYGEDIGGVRRLGDIRVGEVADGRERLPDGVRPGRSDVVPAHMRHPARPADPADAAGEDSQALGASFVASVEEQLEAEADP